MVLQGGEVVLGGVVGGRGGDQTVAFGAPVVAGERPWLFVGREVDGVAEHGVAGLFVEAPVGVGVP